jgi:hypothetical protein
MLQDLTGFGSVLDVPASEVEATSAKYILSSFAELVQITPMTTWPPSFDFAI